MLMGKAFINALLVGFILTGCVISRANDENTMPTEAWQVSKEFKATERDLYNIPISEINSDWKLVLALDLKYLKGQLTDAQFINLQKSPLTFIAESRFNSDSDKEIIFVGVYESYSGEKGRFIAIMRKSKVVKYFQHPGLSGYSSVYLENNQLRWYKCMNCNDYDSIQWSGSDYVLY